MSETKERKDVYAIVTERIIHQLEKGVVPWQKPWRADQMPKNLVSGRPYRGINLMLLSTLGYEHNLFLSKKQITDLGASAKEKERPHMVVFWKWIEVSDEDTQEILKVPFLRYYYVFNVGQCDGIPSNLIPTYPEPVVDPIPNCEKIVVNMPNPPELRHKENEAYYNPLLDYVNMPKASKFKEMTGYYAVLFHELVHSTGHSSRLGRKEVMQQVKYGSDPYSVEELTAEIGTCFLKSFAGIGNEQFENNVAYIQGWLAKLKDDKKFIVYASSCAQRAADYILNLKPEEVTTEAGESLPQPVAEDLPF